MAIYFGNLDRELADRQNVLKEDAARQYRGHRDVQQAFGSLGNTVSSSIKDVAQAKLDQAKLEYNVERNKKADEIRAAQHAQSTQRNKELSLQSELKNIAGFNKVKIQEHIGKQWYWRDPKAIRASYDERMKIFTADKINLDETDRIMRYPHLFGKKGKDALTKYNELLKLKADGVDITDENLQLAKDKLPLTPLNFMDWATETEQFNPNIKGSPTRIGGAMYTSALQRYGYDIPDVTTLYKQATEESSQENGALKLVEEKDKDKKTIADKLGVEDIRSEEEETINTKKAEAIAKKKVSLLGILTDESGVGHVVDSFLESDAYLDETVTSVDGMSAEEAAATESYGGIADTVVDNEGDYSGSGLAKVADESGELYTVDGFYYGPGTGEDDKKIGEQVRELKGFGDYTGNPFTAAATVENKTAINTLTDTLKSWGVYGRTQEAADRMNQQNKAIGAEIKKKRRKEEEEGEREALTSLETIGSATDYKKLSAYKNTNSWVTLSNEEKTKLKTELSQHPSVDMFGASIETVFNYETARENLAVKENEINYLKAQVDKHTTDLTEDQDLESFKKIGSALSGKQGKQYDGLIGTNPELERAKMNLAMGLPVLNTERNELLANLTTAESAMVASQTRQYENAAERKKRLKEFKVKELVTDNRLGGRDFAKETRDWGPSSEVTKPAIEYHRQTSPSPGTGVEPDLGYQAAVKANYAEDTQKEIIGGIIDREGFSPAGEGYSYYDGTEPSLDGSYIKGVSDTLTLAGGNNIWGTINTMSGKERAEAIKEVATTMFGNGGVQRKEFIRFINMPKEDHKKEYGTRYQRGKLRLEKHQRNFLTTYSYNNHLKRMVKYHPYLTDIAQYPKEMQVFLMDNAFNMGPGWLKDFTETEKHLKNWVINGRKPSDLEKMKKEYKNSDHYKETTRAKDLIALLDNADNAY